MTEPLAMLPLFIALAISICLTGILLYLLVTRPLVRAIRAQQKTLKLIANLQARTLPREAINEAKVETEESEQIEAMLRAKSITTSEYHSRRRGLVV